ncbi:BgtE-20072-2 [Blumeria graminis f. sp. tritici]|uniref:BgtE-20072-2 n=2 Tax=Blumeria graminis TaxID=34373 RepID=A0A9X9L7T6_BLUGR|nr:BgtE-20072-2 [Blumeria graminis f. sp. tritici]
MKFFTISGISTLFCIIAPVTALEPVPDMKRNFSFECPTGNEFTKAALLQRVLFVNQFIFPYKPDLQSYYKFVRFGYDIPEIVHHYPMEEGPGPHDFVIFNINNRIVGVASRVFSRSGDDIFLPCKFTYLN